MYMWIVFFGEGITIMLFSDLSKKQLSLLMECRDIKEAGNLLTHFGYSLDEEQLEEMRLSYAKEYTNKNNSDTLSMEQLEQVAGGARVKVNMHVSNPHTGRIYVSDFTTLTFRKSTEDGKSSFEGKIFVTGNSIVVEKELSEDENATVVKKTPTREEELPEDKNMGDSAATIDRSKEDPIIPRGVLSFRTLDYISGNFLGNILCNFLGHTSLSRWRFGCYYARTDSDSIMFLPQSATSLHFIFSISALERIYKSLPKEEAFYIQVSGEHQDQDKDYVKLSREEAAFFLCIGLSNSLLKQEENQNSSSKYTHKNDNMQAKVNLDTILEVNDEDKKDYEVNALSDEQLSFFHERERHCTSVKTTVKDMAKESNAAVNGKIYNLSINTSFPHKYFSIFPCEERGSSDDLQLSKGAFAENLQDSKNYSNFSFDKDFFENQHVKEIKSKMDEQIDNNIKSTKMSMRGQAAGAFVGGLTFIPTGIVALTVAPVKAFVVTTIAAPIVKAISFLTMSMVSIGLPVLSILLGLGFAIGFGLCACKNYPISKSIRHSISILRQPLGNTAISSSDD